VIVLAQIETIQNSNEDESAATQLRPDNKDVKSAQEGAPAGACFLRGELMAVPIPLEETRSTIGRSIEADVRLMILAPRAFMRASRPKQTQRPWYQLRITDLGSTNAHWLTASQLLKCRLTDGDKIVIGDHLFASTCSMEIRPANSQQIHRLIAHDELTVAHK